MKRRYPSAHCAVLASAILTIACSSSSKTNDNALQVDTSPNIASNPALAGTIRQLGFVGINQIDAIDFTEGFFTGSFARFGEPVNAAAAAQSIVPAQETCDIQTTEVLGVENFNTSLSAAFDVPVELVSAGDNLVVSSPGGTFLTVSRGSIFSGEADYRLPEDSVVPTPVPNSLTVDIPGDVFPAFANVPIPDALPLTGLVVSGNGFITPETRYSWEPNGDTNSHVLVNVFALDLETFEFTDIVCAAQDDGDFTLPAATRAELGNDFRATELLISRQAVSYYRNGDALVVVTNNGL